MGNKIEKEKSEYYEHFQKIKSYQITPFEKINNKNILFDLFVIVNSETFQKAYLDSTFLSFLKYNEELIKQIFGENLKYNELLEKNDYNEDKQNELFNTIAKDSNDIKALSIIICSFYYLLFYKFKDVKEIKGRTNLGNVYINMILGTFVKFLSTKFSNINPNLDIILKELYYFDITNSDYKNNDKVNDSYYFSDAEKLMSTCGANLKAKFELDKKEYKKEANKNAEIFESLANRVCEDSIFYNFYLKRIDKNIYSNIITIIIDILHREDNEKEWKNFMNYFDKESIFYFYKWSSDTKKYLLSTKNDDTRTINVKSLSKISGTLLADILISNKLFNNFQINLVGFNLGANVVKYCLKNLAELNGKKNYVKIKNVLLIGAAIHIKHEDKWKEIIKNNIVDKFINCYSSSDTKLKDFYSMCSDKNKPKKSPSGISTLEIKDDKNINLVTNVDFSGDKYDQSSYDFGKVAEKVFQYK